MWHALKSRLHKPKRATDVGHTADYCPQSGGQHSIPNTVTSTNILLDLLGHVRLPFYWLWQAEHAPFWHQFMYRSVDSSPKHAVCVQGHRDTRCLNLFGSNRYTAVGQAAGRRLEGRAKMKMTQRQNIDTLDWSIEKVSNYLWEMLTYRTVILKVCVKILSVACIKLLYYHHISRNWLLNQKSKASLIIFACWYTVKCNSTPR